MQHLGVKIAVAIVALIGASALQVWLMRDIARSESAPEAVETCPPPWGPDDLDAFVWFYEDADGELYEESCQRDNAGWWRCKRSNTPITGVIDYEN